MTANVVVDLSMSLDGFITGPNDGPDNGLGDGGERLHDWLFSGATAYRRGGSVFQPSSPQVLDEAFNTTGAMLMGRRWFDIGEPLWGDNPPFQVPVFIVTHRPRAQVAKLGGTSYTFVSDGLESALRQARAAAGDKNVGVGGANIAQQLLKAGLLDEIQVHLVPLLLGKGRRLFEQFGPEPVELEITRVIESLGVTHLRYRVVK